MQVAWALSCANGEPQKGSQQGMGVRSEQFCALEIPAHKGGGAALLCVRGTG